jgi:cyanate permease
MSSLFKKGGLMPVLGMLARKLGVRRSILLGSFIYSAGFAITNWTIQVCLFFLH